MVKVPHGGVVLKRGRNEYGGYDWVLWATRVNGMVLVYCWTDRPDTPVERLIMFLKRYWGRWCPRWLSRKKYALANWIGKKFIGHANSGVLLAPDDLVLIDHIIGR